MACGPSSHLAFSRKLHMRIGAVVFLICVIYFCKALIAPPVAATRRAWGIPKSDLATFAKHAINNTVVIVPVNAGMLHWAENLICSLSAVSFDASVIVFWALDDKAQDVLARKGFSTYRDASLFSVSGNENKNGNTPDYQRMMRQRPKFFMDVLSSGYDLLMIDADIVFYQSPMLLLPHETDRDNVDMVYSTDSREFYQTQNAFQDAYRRGRLMPPICNGLFWMKSSNETISLWSEMLDVFEASWWTMGIYRSSVFQDDQRGIDVLLNDGRARIVEPFPEGITEAIIPNSRDRMTRLNVRLLEQAQAVNGHLFIERRTTYEENLSKIRAAGRDRISVHMNWNTEYLTKEEGARAANILFLDENGHCKIHS